MVRNKAIQKKLLLIFGHLLLAFFVSRFNKVPPSIVISTKTIIPSLVFQQ